MNFMCTIRGCDAEQVGTKVERCRRCKRSWRVLV